MPADNLVPTPRLRFVSRFEEVPNLNPVSSPPAASRTGRVVRILQQQWVVAGTYWGQEGDKNSEWRDVPLVMEDGKEYRDSFGRTIEGRRALSLPDYEKPPLGKPSSA